MKKMDSKVYRLWLAEKKGPLTRTETIERICEINSINDLRNAIADTRDSLFLYLGPYELGELYGCSKSSLSFFTLFGIKTGDNCSIQVELFEKVMTENITIESLFKTIFPQYSLRVAEDANRAWELIQNDWNSVFRVIRSINTLQVKNETMFNEKRIFFIK